MTGQYNPQRRTCDACRRVFTCDSAYHLHIVGRRSQTSTLRCRTDSEMRLIGMEQREDGAWKSRAAQPKPIDPNNPPRKPWRRGPFA